MDVDLEYGDVLEAGTTIFYIPCRVPLASALAMSVGDQSRGIHDKIFNGYDCWYHKQLWVWSSKTLTSWRQFFHHIQGRRAEAYV